MEKITTEIAEYSLKDSALQELSKVDAGLADLRAKYAGKVYEVTTSAGMDEAKKARVDIRNHRYPIPKIVDERKKQLKAIGNEIENEGDRIAIELLELEQPIDAQIKVEEERKEAEKAEKARLAAEAQAVLNAKIIEIGKLPLKCMGKSAEEI